MTAVTALLTEAAEIRANIRAAVQAGEITWQQREELIALVDADVRTKLSLAANLLHDWTGKYKRGDLPQGA